jgi:6-pyruvoyl-tetrahydropterin synthase
MDHRFLNYEVPPFEEVVPSTANVALEIWRRIEPQVSSPSTRLSRVRLFETADLYVDVDREDLAA